VGLLVTGLDFAGQINNPIVGFDSDTLATIIPYITILNVFIKPSRFD
jgi:hypothetical protein